MTATSQRVRRPLVGIALACTILAVLTGCSLAPRGGQTAKQAALRIKQIPGVTLADADSSNAEQAPDDAITIVEVSLAPDYTVGDPAKALDWLLKTAWSMNNTSPTHGVIVGFQHAKYAPVTWDWKEAITALGIPQDINKSGFYFSSGPLAGALDFDSKTIAKYLGAWPGKVPTLPDGVIVKG